MKTPTMLRGILPATVTPLDADGRFVRADCKDAKGTWMRALLDVRECEQGDEIVNEDAEIICRAPAPPAPPPPPTPPPSPQASLTFYDGKSFEGASKTLTGDAPDLAPLGWTNIASSLQVVGVWEVCDEPNYAGHCERIVDDEANLDDLELSDRISSVRQVREPKAPATP